MTQINPQAGDTGIFIPRSVDPARNASGSPYWTNSNGGGYGGSWAGRNNPWTNSTLYNCTSYAFGRMLEILDTSFQTQFDPLLFDFCKYKNADEWFSSAARAGWDVIFPIGAYALKQGYIMCWSSPNYEGHLAVIEEVGSGYVRTSEGHWYSGRFTYNYRADDGHWSQGSDATFLGCIAPFNFSGSGPEPPAPAPTKSKMKWIYYLKHLPF